MNYENQRNIIRHCGAARRRIISISARAARSIAHQSRGNGGAQLIAIEAENIEAMGK
jgi:hypothetical protein